jgi:outer membrane lipoprotein-sorting protein
MELKSILKTKFGTPIDLRNNMKNISTLLIGFLFATSCLAQAPDMDKLFQDMQSVIKTHKTLRFHLNKIERMKGKMEPGEQDVKLNMSPFKVYLKVLAPNKGAEVIYLAGKNDGNCLVNPNAFPYMNLNLDPDGAILRKGQHHGIKQLSFKYTGEVLGSVYKKYQKKINDYVEYKGDITWDGRDCYHIQLDNKEYALVDYKVQAGEDIIDIARKTNTNEYMLLEQNKLKNFDSVKAGQTIKVPNSYCKSITMYVDKELKLPIYQKMYDEVGHSATYEYTKVQINPSFSADEFTKEFKEYDF